MSSVVFDKLWKVAFDREGELVKVSARLAKAYGLTSAMESVRLARVFHEAGSPLYDYCERLYEAKKQLRAERIRRQYHLSPAEMQFVKQMMDKASKGL